MFHALNWFIVLSLLAVWSFAAWAFGSIGAWALSSAGFLAGGSGVIEALRIPQWLAPWVPPELAADLALTVSAAMPAVQSALAWAPSLAGGLSVAVWVIWALGSALLVGLGVGLSAVIALLRRRSATTSASARGARVAASR